MKKILYIFAAIAIFVCATNASLLPTNKATAKANKTAVDNNHAQFSNLQNQNADCPSACAGTCHSTSAPPILLQNTTATIKAAGKDEHCVRATKSKYGDVDEQASVIVATGFIGAVTIPKVMPDIPINIATATLNTKENTLQQTTANGIQQSIAAFTDTGQDQPTALNCASGWNCNDSDKNVNNTLGDTGKEITAWNTDGKLPTAGCNNSSGSIQCPIGYNFS